MLVSVLSVMYTPSRHFFFSGRPNHSLASPAHVFGCPIPVSAIHTPAGFHAVVRPTPGQPVLLASPVNLFLVLKKRRAPAFLTPRGHL